MTRTSETNNNVILEVEGLKKYFPVHRGFLQRVVGWIKAVDGVDLRLSVGKTLGLVGESGCGKSTLARLILKLIEPDAGKILFQGIDITELSRSEMQSYRRRMQIIFQDPFGSLNPRMTVGQAIEEGLRTIQMGGREQRQSRVAELLEMVHYEGDRRRSFVRGEGCALCHDTGCQGRTGIYELLVCDHELRRLIVHDPTLDGIRQWRSEKGGRSLFDEALRLAANKQTSLEEAMRVAFFE